MGVTRRASLIESKRFIGAAIACLALITSYPLFTSTIPYGHDMIFHLARIESIAQGLSQGLVPVRLYQAQAYGFGYPTGICYPDLFLYLPAALCALGLSLKASYALFVLLVNAATATIALFSFKRLFHSTKTGLFLSALWTLAPYRLCCVLVRAAVGEYLALMFAPLLVWGLWATYELEEHNGEGGVLCLSVAAAGIVYSHILSVALFLVAALPFLIVLMAWGRAPHKLANTLKALVLTALLSAAFTIPFLTYYTTHALEVQQKVQRAADHALEPAQLFGAFLNFFGSSKDIGSDLIGEMGLYVGWPLLAAPAAWFAFGKSDETRPASRCQTWVPRLLLIIAALLMIATTYLFPWDAYGKTGIVGTIVSKLYIIQFPWRLLGQIELLLVVLWGVVATRADKQALRHVGMVVLCFALIEAGHASGSYMSNTVRNSDELLASLNVQQKTLTSGGEYLPLGIDRTYLYEADGAEPKPKSPEVDVTDWERTDAQSLSIELTNRSKERQSILLPLFWHEQWRIETATHDASPEDVSLTNADGYVLLTVNPGFSGTIDVVFEEPLFWRIAELTSLVTLLGVVTYEARTYWRKHEKRNERQARAD